MMQKQKRIIRYISYVGYLLFAIGTIFIIANFDMLLYSIFLLIGALLQIPDFYTFAKEKYMKEEYMKENKLALFWVAKFIGFVFFTVLMVLIIFSKYILPSI